MTEYDKYILNWMIDHNHSIKELKDKIDEIYLDCIYNDDWSARYDFNEMGYQEQSEYIWKLFLEQGFDGEIWVCYEEWENNEKMGN